VFVDIDTMEYAQTYYGRLDIVVNNVGYWNESDYQTVMDINLVCIRLQIKLLYGTYRTTSISRTTLFVVLCYIVHSSLL